MTAYYFTAKFELTRTNSHSLFESEIVSITNASQDESCDKTLTNPPAWQIRKAKIRPCALFQYLFVYCLKKQLAHTFNWPIHETLRKALETISKSPLGMNITSNI